HDPLLDWTRENRRALVRACLILCRNWIAAGMPGGTERMGSYDNYARVLGGILRACGVQGFLLNRKRRVSRKPEQERWNALISEWFRRHATRLISTAHAWEMIRADKSLGEAFADILDGKSEESQKKKLGKRLAAAQDRVFTATLYDGETCETSSC